jgi:hypothetical protein
MPRLNDGDRRLIEKIRRTFDQAGGRGDRRVRQRFHRPLVAIAGDGRGGDQPERGYGSACLKGFDSARSATSSWAMPTAPTSPDSGFLNAAEGGNAS